ncbi:MAG: patatin-like phospholipase family protein [Colwellia sp.]|uniref:patatin-like phospholipase family protein n=1 Tax=Colwellia sp. TaxID=56799 RepID=UPI0025BF79A1|nr:patatin-like phospholipase family protein [Colwellia sp.]NQZ26969.1 patatin-like phospholipase family protein [Colwellia sp.]
MLEIYAGKNALKTIQEQGFKQELFTNFLGASGGPKWFTLFGLDKYLFGDFFKNRTTELNLIGSSAGAFRAACLTQNNPVQAIEGLAHNYAHTVYSKKPSAEEIASTAVDIVDQLFANNGASEVINNKVFKAHFLVAKCNGLTAFDNKIIQGAGLIQSILLNKIGRRFLSKQYQRYIFKHPSSNLTINDPYNFDNVYQKLTADNIKDALLASGSIPMVMSGIQNIEGSAKGTYRDGGIIDYHFDFSLNNGAQEHCSSICRPDEDSQKVTSIVRNHGLTLYPHFSSEPKAGWFDKNSSRKVLASSYENTVLLAPSAKFIQSLPFNKIPDRTDFTELDSSTRIKYWLKVLEQTDRLAECFNEFVMKQDIAKIKAFQP